MTVRFPNGQTLTYPQAKHVTQGIDRWDLYTGDPDAGGKWVASIQGSAGAVVEGMPATRVENPIRDVTIERALAMIVERGRGIPALFNGAALGRLKALLNDFDARRNRWRDE